VNNNHSAYLLKISTMQQRERYYIPAHGPDKAAVTATIKKAIERSNALPDVGRIVFLTYDLKNTQWLEEQFGHDAAKKLKEGGTFKSTAAIGKFDSVKTYKSKGNDIVIAFCLRSDNLLLVDDSYDISAMFVIPWINEDIEKWKRITNAINITDNVTSASYDQPPCEVRQALQNLTKTINTSTGITNPSDSDLAKTYLRALNKAGFALNALNIESYLIKDLNWSKVHSDELLEIINKINAGKSFQGGDKTGHKYHIDRWKKACAEQ